MSFLLVRLLIYMRKLLKLLLKRRKQTNQPHIYRSHGKARTQYQNMSMFVRPKQENIASKEAR